MQKEDEEILEIHGPYIVTIGRLVQNKRTEDIIHGFTQISDEFRDWKLVIVGDGPLKEELQAFANETGLGNRLIFTGLVRSPGMLLNHAELFVSASITEAFPMAICEAMASGLAVVVREYNVSVRDIITDDVSGVIVEDQSLEKLASAMAKLMGDESH